MKTGALTALLLALVSVNPVDASAQAASSAAAGGSRVRIHRLGEPTRIGTLVDVPRDLLVVQWLTGVQDTIPTSAISKLEFSNGKQRFAARGALIGLVAGTGVGLIVRSVQNSSLSGLEPRSARILPLSIVTGVTLGGLLGAMGTDDWQTVPIGAPARVGFVGDVAHRRFGFGLARSF